MDSKNNESHALLTDVPIEATVSDHLSFKGTAEILAGAAVETENTITIGVYGEWGSGKTSLMRLIQEKVDDKPEAVAVWFNSWQYEKEEHLIVPLVATIKKQLERKSTTLSEELKEGAKSMINALRAIAYGFSIKGKVGVPLVSEAEVNLSPKDMIDRYQDLLVPFLINNAIFDLTTSVWEL
ncbi:MAG: P-loop NTPase fold protein [bacterium]